jgi:hypothetical protein
MSRAERRALVERTDPALPVSQQCRLLAVSRSSVYRRPTEVSEVVIQLTLRHEIFYASTRPPC